MGKISDALDKIATLNELDLFHAEETEVLLQEAEQPFSQTIRTVSDAWLLTNPSQDSGQWDDRLFKAVNNSSSVMPGVFNALRAKILDLPDGITVPKSIMVSSSIPKEGKSFVAANLGVSFANGMDQNCLLVDCNLRQPSLAHALGINQRYGLVDYLRDQVDLASLIVKSSVQKLSVLPSGSVTNKPEELLSLSRIHAFIEDVSNIYVDNTIVFDGPPMLMAAESIVLADQVDAIIMVVRQNWAKKTEVQEFVDVVDKTKIFGIVFNEYR